ncbi:MAG: nicotinate-nucleotide--dimethylbenzimidazole phosphoribosyltransferase, partial [Pontibacterium sp.]
MTTFSELIDTPSASLCETSRQAAQARQKILTKPLGALSRMEDIAIDLAELQGRTCPQIKTVAISVFAADHGIAANGVSAYPQAVTAQMVSNFAHGGAAVAVMANRLGAKFEVVTLGTVGDVAPHERVVERTIAPSTDDFSKGYAMTPEQLERAMCVGAERVDALEQCDLFIAGEMGIGNTSSASALAAALLNINVADITGPGTGLDHTGVSKKAAILTAAVSHHTQDDPGALTLLMRLGGFEIVAMVGAYIRAAQRG